MSCSAGQRAGGSVVACTVRPSVHKGHGAESCEEDTSRWPPLTPVVWPAAVVIGHHPKCGPEACTRATTPRQAPRDTQAEGLGARGLEKYLALAVHCTSGEVGPAALLAQRREDKRSTLHAHVLKQAHGGSTGGVVGLCVPKHGPSGSIQSVPCELVCKDTLPFRVVAKASVGKCWEVGDESRELQHGAKHL